MSNIANKMNVFKRPQLISIEADLLSLLQIVFPKLDFNNIQFYQGLPWFIMESKANAVTLPHSLSLYKINIYFQHFDPFTVKGLALIVHELVHAQQYENFKLKGLGFIRPFTFYYFALHFKYGYWNNPLEREAYEIERRFFHFYSQSRNRVEQKDLLLYLQENLPAYIIQYPVKINTPVAIIYKVWSAILISLAAMIIPLVNIILYPFSLFFKTGRKELRD